MVKQASSQFPSYLWLTKPFMSLRRAADETSSPCSLAPTIYALVPRQGATMR